MVLTGSFSQAAKKALGILLAVILLWSTEALPIYATALLIPLPAILMQTSLEGHCVLLTSPVHTMTGIPCTDDSMCGRYVTSVKDATMEALAQWNLENQGGGGDRTADKTEVRRHLDMEAIAGTGDVSGNGKVKPEERRSGAGGGGATQQQQQQQLPAKCHFDVLPSPLAAKKISSMYFAPIAFQFLGIFSIASAMKKLGLDRKMASAVLALAGTNPRTILLAIMLVGWFLSMWITNVAAAVVVLSLVAPLLQTFEHDTFPKCVLLGIAYSCNIAGMASTIASPQNLLANSALESAGVAPVTFFQWLVVGGVTSLLGVVLTYLFLLTYFKPTAARLPETVFDSRDVQLNAQHLFVVLVALGTIGFWCVGSIPGLKMAFGDVALLGAVPVAVFLGTQILTKNDFLFFSWDIILLVGGGLTLGYVVTSSRLLQIMTGYLVQLVGNDPTKTIWLFGLFTWFFSNFISHTVAAAIIMPVIAASSSTPQLAVLLATLLDSGACALPISGFPNALAFAQKDSLGRPFLTTMDYLTTGVPVGIMAILLVNSVGNFLALLAKV